MTKKWIQHKFFPKAAEVFHSWIYPLFTSLFLGHVVRFGGNFIDFVFPHLYTSRSKLYGVVRWIQEIFFAILFNIGDAQFFIITYYS